MVGGRTLALCVVLCGSITVCWSQMGFGGMGMDMGAMGMDMGAMGMNMGMGAMGMMGMMGRGGGLSPANYAMLDSAVKQVIGPHASVDPQILAFARTQGGPPTTLMQMMPYVQLFQDLGDRVGVSGVPKKPVLPTTGNMTMGDVFKFMQPLPTARDVVMSRAVEWFNQNQMASAAGGMF